MPIAKAAQYAGDEIEFHYETNAQEQLVTASLRGVGGPKLLNLLSHWRAHLSGKLNEIPLPTGTSGAELLLREVILKAQGRWQYPYEEEELCHCRAVPTKVVDSAILQGATRPELVSRWTSASTACGTCRKNVEAIIAYRTK